MAQDRCSRCGHEVSVDARFCRECGEAIAVATSTAAACPSCEAPTAPGAHFCRACGHELAPAPTAPTSPPVPPGTKAGAERAPPTPVTPIISPWTTAPSSWRKGWRPSRIASAGIALVLVAVVAGSAYALTREDGDGGNGQTAAAPEAVEPAPIPDEEASVAPTATAETTSEVPAAPPTTTNAPTTGGAQAGNTNPNTPTGVMRAHWTAISEGDYSAAYQLFSSHFRSRTSEDRWTSAEADYAPKIHINNVLYLRQLPGLQAFVLVDILTRDAGPKGDSSNCNRFAGKVRVIKENGDWRYWAIGPGATWGKRPKLSSGDPRCESLFS